MVAADAVAVAVAAGNDDLELVIGQLGAGGHCQSASMQRVHAVGADDTQAGWKNSRCR